MNPSEYSQQAALFYNRLVKRYKHLKKYEIILAIVSSIIICGGHFFMIYLDLSKDIQFIIDIFFLACIIIMKIVFGV